MTPGMDFVIALSSTVTATAVVVGVREIHQTRQTIEQNHERSRTNREILREEGLVAEHLPTVLEETDG